MDRRLQVISTVSLCSKTFAWSPSGDALAVVSGRGEIEVLSSSQGHHIHTLTWTTSDHASKTQSLRISCLAWAPAPFIAVGVGTSHLHATSNRVHIWNAASLTNAASPAAASAQYIGAIRFPCPVTMVEWSPAPMEKTSTHVYYGASCTADNSVCVWSVARGGLNTWAVIPLMTRGFYVGANIFSLAWSPDGAFIAFATPRLRIMRTDALQERSDESPLFKEPTTNARGRSVIVDKIAWLPDGEGLITCNRKRKYSIWKITDAGPALQEMHEQEQDEWWTPHYHAGLERHNNDERKQVASRVSNTGLCDIYSDGVLAHHNTGCPHFSGCGFYWSPNKQAMQVAFVSRQAHTPRLRVWTLCKWTDRTHRFFPRALKRIVFCLMVIHYKAKYDQEKQHMPQLPIEIWLDIIGCIANDMS